MVRFRPLFVVLSLASVLAGSLRAQLTIGDAGTALPTRAAPFAFFDQPRGRLTLFGGDDGTATRDDCWQLDDGAWVQIPVTAGNFLAYGACCEDPARFGAAVLFSGRRPDGTLSPQTLRWNRGTMRFDVLSPATSPPARWVSAMAFDSNRGRAVLFGGGASWWFGDTWEWDGTNWQQRFPAVSPPPRSHHAMAFDAARGRVVLFGGHNGASLGDTWTYDGTTWTQRTGSSPGALHDAMLAYDAHRGVVVKFGGKTDAGIVNDQVWEWNGTGWSRPILPAVRPPARELAAFVYDPQRRVVTLAGGLAGSTRFSDAWHWNGTTWTEARPRDRGTRVVPPARFGATLGYNAFDRKLVLHGGYTKQGLFDVPLTDTWERAGEVWQQRTPTVTPPANFGGVGAILRGTGAMCYVPGKDGLGNPYNSQWVFGSNGNWSSVSLNSAPLVPTHQVMGSLLSSQFGWVLVRLVTTGTGVMQGSTLQLIVPNTGTVQTMFPGGGPPPLVGSSMAQSPSAVLEPDRVWLFGGVSQSSGGPVYSNDLWLLADSGTGGNLAWTRVVPNAGSPVPPPRRDASVAVYAASLVAGSTTAILVSGGRDANGAVLNDLWYFRNGQWTSLPTGVAARHSAATASAPTSGAGGSLVAFGGLDGSGLLLGDLVESAFGGSLTSAAVWERPAPRWGAAMAYDRANQRTLLFGGDLYRDDLWRYDGTTWQPMVPVGPTPGPRRGAAVCFDEANAAMILFGGYRAPADTWKLSAAGWSLRSSTGPAKRDRAAMAYVASAQRCLLFGGFDDGWSVFPPMPALYGDTWLYDASADQWTPVPSGPPARYHHAMAYDRLRDCVVLFGGTQGQNTAPLDDTWEYRLASGWQQRAPAHRPPGLQGHTMVFDEARGRVVASGGVHYVPNTIWPGMAPSTAVWEWDGVDWMQRVPDTVASGRVSAAAVYDAARARVLGVGGATLYFNSFGEYHQGVTDDLFELHARIDLAGRGNTSSPEGLRFYSQPVLGQTLHLGFANPNGVAWGMYALGPTTTPWLYPAPPACEPSFVYPVGPSQLVSGTVEPNWSLTVPNSPTFVGQTLSVQAWVLQQPASCWRLTDALHVRF